MQISPTNVPRFGATLKINADWARVAPMHLKDVSEALASDAFVKLALRLQELDQDLPFKMSFEVNEIKQGQYGGVIHADLGDGKIRTSAKIEKQGTFSEFLKTMVAQGRTWASILTTSEAESQQELRDAFHFLKGLEADIESGSFRLDSSDFTYTPPKLDLQSSRVEIGDTPYTLHRQLLPPGDSVAYSLENLDDKPILYLRYQLGTDQFEELTFTNHSTAPGIDFANAFKQYGKTHVERLQQVALQLVHSLEVRSQPSPAGLTQ